MPRRRINTLYHRERETDGVRAVGRPRREHTDFEPGARRGHFGREGLGFARAPALAFAPALAVVPAVALALDGTLGFGTLGFGVVR